MPIVALGTTHRSAADAWECDQMQHVNVRFLGRRFMEAERRAAVLLDLPEPQAEHRVWSFRQEVRPGAPLRIDTWHEPASRRLIHRLFDAGSEQPSATLEATFGGDDAQPDGAGDRWQAAGWQDTGCTEAGGDAGPGAETLFRLINHAAAQLGLDRHRLRREDGSLALGSALVACEAGRRHRLDAHAPIAVRSRLARPGRSSIQILHRLHDPVTGRIATTVRATHVFFDMRTRRPVPLPAALRAAADG